MERADLIARLNWFYSLELNQADFYMAQSRTFVGSYESIVFERTAYIEQGHADDIAAGIKTLGGKPVKLGDVLSPIIGMVAGSVLSISGMENTLKTIIMIEQKAIKEYTELINTLKEEYGSDLKKTLKQNLIDEDVHAAWFSMRLADYDHLVLA